MPARSEGQDAGARARPRRSLAGRARVRDLLVKAVALLALWLGVLALSARTARSQAAAAGVARGVSRGDVAALGDSAPVAAHALPRGHTITAADVAWIAADSLARLGPARTDARGASVVGATTRRVVAAGEPLRAPAVVPAVAITAGDRVAVVYRDAGIELRLQGTAVNAAAVGGRVTVRLDNRRRLTGTASAPGVVQID
jgi:flagella basal body P-ring formation protein FlgA